MKTVCAWCKKTVIEGIEEVASHGICEECLKKYYPEYYRRRKQGIGICVECGKEIEVYEDGYLCGGGCGSYICHACTLLIERETGFREYAICRACWKEGMRFYDYEGRA